MHYIHYAISLIENSLDAINNSIDSRIGKYIVLKNILSSNISSVAKYIINASLISNVYKFFVKKETSQSFIPYGLFFSKETMSNNNRLFSWIKLVDALTFIGTGSFLVTKFSNKFNKSNAEKVNEYILGEVKFKKFNDINKEFAELGKHLHYSLHILYLLRTEGFLTKQISDDTLSSNNQNLITIKKESLELMDQFIKKNEQDHIKAVKDNWFNFTKITKEIIGRRNYLHLQKNSFEDELSSSPTNIISNGINMVIGFFIFTPQFDRYLNKNLNIQAIEEIPVIDPIISYIPTETARFLVRGIFTFIVIPTLVDNFFQDLVEKQRAASEALFKQK